MEFKLPPTGTYRYEVQLFTDGELAISVFRYKRTDSARDLDRFHDYPSKKGRRLLKEWRGVKTTNDITGYLKTILGEDL